MQIAMNGTPLRERLPEPVNVAPPAELQANIESACRRGLPQMPCFRPHGQELVICAGGPSLRRALPEVKRRAKAGAFVIAVNKASEYLLQHDVADKIAVVLLDPQELLNDQFAADRRCAYFVASQVHPAAFDRLSGHEVLIWHGQDSGRENEIIRRYYPDPVIIGGGTTAALRTIGIGQAMGFCRMHIYGLDGSFEAGPNGEMVHHAYTQNEDDMPECVIVRLDGDDREFLTRPDYARQADEFMDLLHQYRRLAKAGVIRPLLITVHGDGLIPHIWRKRRHELG